MSRQLYRRWRQRMNCVEHMEARVGARLQRAPLWLADARSNPPATMLRAGKLPPDASLPSDAAGAAAAASRVSNVNARAAQLLKEAALRRPEVRDPLIDGSLHNPLRLFVERQMEAMSRGKSYQESFDHATELEKDDRQELVAKLSAFRDASEGAKAGGAPPAVAARGEAQERVFAFFRDACRRVPYARWQPREQAYLDAWILLELLEVTDDHLYLMVRDAEVHRLAESVRTTLFERAEDFPEGVRGDAQAEAAYVYSRDGLHEDPIADFIGDDELLLRDYVAWLERLGDASAGRLAATERVDLEDWVLSLVRMDALLLDGEMADRVDAARRSLFPALELSEPEDAETPMEREVEATRGASLALAQQQTRRLRVALQRLKEVETKNGEFEGPGAPRTGAAAPQSDVDFLLEQIRRTAGEPDAERMAAAAAAREETRKELLRARIVLLKDARFGDELRTLLADVRATGGVGAPTLRAARGAATAPPSGGLRGLARRAAESFRREGIEAVVSAEEAEKEDLEATAEANMSLARWLDAAAAKRADWREHVEAPVQVGGTWTKRDGETMVPKHLLHQGPGAKDRDSDARLHQPAGVAMRDRATGGPARK